MQETTNLSGARRALLDKYLRGDLQQTTTTVSAIPRRPSSGPAPLSFGQQQLWLLAQLMPDTPLYNESLTLGLTGALDVPLLEQSLNEFINRHEAWRTIFPVIDGEPAQVVLPALPLTLQEIDLSHLPVAEREDEATRLATKNAVLPFDLAHGPLLRALLIHLNDSDHHLYMTLHHIIFDAVAVYQIFLPELHTLYEAFSQGKPSPFTPLPIQYTDFATWQRESLQKDAFANDIAFWREQLTGAPRLLELSTDRPRPAVQTYSGSMQTFALSRQLTDALKTLSRQEGVTLFMTLTAAFQTLLHRYTDQTDLVIGTVTSDRKRPEVQKLVGYFLNTLVLRTNMQGNPTFRELLGRVRDVVKTARRHEDVPFEYVVKALQPERTLSYNPLIQVMLAYQPSLPALPPGWKCSQMDVQTYTTKFDLSLELDERSEGLIGRFIYSTDLFDDATITRMIEHWQTLLEAIVTDPGQSLNNLPLLTPAERQRLLVEWNATGTASAQMSLPHLFEAQVERTPDEVAVVLEKQELTYRELNARANQLAHHLQRSGVGPEVMVGVCVERSLEMTVGLLGILKAGGVYVPLDPEYPQERLAFLIHDTQMPVLLTQQRLLSRLAHQNGKLLCLDTDWDQIAQESRANPLSEATGENLAYVIYTSGSTGQPKGVCIPHKALATHCCSIIQVYELRPQDRVLQFSTFTFDPSLEQILPTLLVGARVVLRGQEMWSPAQLLKHIERDQLTVMNLPPAYWQQVAQEWMNVPERRLNHHLRLVIVGGDRLLPEYLQRWRQTALHSARLLNAYGPTETIITSTLYDTVSYTTEHVLSESVPIGRPLSGRSVYILDRSGAPVPIGVPGKLHIGGDLLARGYLNRPELTAERFIPDPFSPDPNARLYKTGDLARYLANGTIEFLGRVDQQVKIRGFRVELGEIEEVLSEHPTVQEVVVMAREVRPGEAYLTAYVVAHKGKAVESQVLRTYLKEKVPEYLIPAVFVSMENLPQLSTGKIDRRALPAPELSRLTQEETFVAPASLLQQRLAQIWEEMLDVRPIGIKDNFFTLGGHSLLAARLVDRIEHVFGKRIALSTLFTQPTIEQLANTLHSSQGTEGARSSILPVQAGGSKRPFFFLHGDWTGGAFYCFTLARALGSEQPFYVLETYQFSDAQPIPSLEGIAASHIAAMRTIQPEGPYLLGGFCNGALLAYEMAHQLQVAGESVDFLGLINPSAPIQFKTMHALSRFLGKLTLLRVDMQGTLFLRMRHALRHVYRHLRPGSERVQDFAQLLAIDPRLDKMFPPVDALHNDYVGVFTWVVAHYEIGMCPGKITFYWAREEPFIEESWRPIIQAKESGDVENVAVSGTHMSCVTEHIEDLARSLNSSVGQVHMKTLAQPEHISVRS